MLGDHEPGREDDEGYGDERQGGGDQNPEELGAVAEPVGRVHHDEAGRGQSGREQERDDDVLGAAVRRPRRDDAFLVGGAFAALATEQQRAEHEQPLRRPHGRARSPIAAHTATSTSAASSQVTMPSGTGPTFPMPQPPRFTGCCARRT